MCARGEMHNDYVGNVKLAKYVDGHSPKARYANRRIIAASRELAQEVIRLRELIRDAFKEGYTVHQPSWKDSGVWSKHWQVSNARANLEMDNTP